MTPAASIGTARKSCSMIGDSVASTARIAKYANPGFVAEEGTVSRKEPKRSRISSSGKSLHQTLKYERFAMADIIPRRVLKFEIEARALGREKFCENLKASEAYFFAGGVSSSSASSA